MPELSDNENGERRDRSRVWRLCPDEGGLESVRNGSPIKYRCGRHVPRKFHGTRTGTCLVSL